VSQSDALRRRDIWWAFRLIGDCRDLGYDPRLWHTRMLQGLAITFGVVQAAGGEAWWDRPGHAVRQVSAYSVAAAPAAEEAFRAYHRDNGPVSDPILQAIEPLPDKLVTRTRAQLVPDDVWYRSASFNQYAKLGGTDHRLVSVFQISDRGATSVIALNRALGDRDFSGRERDLLNFFHAEVGQLIGGALVGATDASTETLSPRLRQTLACLLEGDSEKLVAVRLGLSEATVHQYVTALYRKFGVQSRAQLLALLAGALPPGTDVRASGLREAGFLCLEELRPIVSPPYRGSGCAMSRE
jgi:DNA-binding CsgD family transcriptional regulator